jgi:hypothetical protein
MLRQERPGGFHCLEQGLRKIFPQKMLAHPSYELLPEFLAALFVDAFIAHHRELLHARRDEDQNRVALGRFLHPELDEFFLGPFERIFLEFSSLKKNPNLSGTSGFGLLDGCYDPIVLELANEIMGAHSSYQPPLEPPPPKLPPPPLNPLNPPPEDHDELLDEPPPQPLLTNGPPKPV